MDLIRPLSAVLSAVAPSLVKRYKQMRAARAPESVPISISDDLYERIFSRLGVEAEQDKTWRSYLSKLDATYISPDVFKKPAYRDWLGTDLVRRDLRNLVHAQMLKVAVPLDVKDRLINEFCNATGESHHYAESAITLITAVLRAGVFADIKDTGTATLVTASHEDISRQLQKIHETANGKSPLANSYVSQTAKSELERILVRRATPEEDFRGQLQKFLCELDAGGKFAQAERALEMEATCWLARAEAWGGETDAAEKKLQELANSGFEIPEAAQALLLMSKGDANTAMQLLRDSKNSDSRSVLFQILFKQKGAKEACDYLDGLGDLSADFFTPVGWNNVCLALKINDEIYKANKILINLPSAIRTKCTYLAYQYAVYHLLPLVSKEGHYHLLDAGFSSLLDHVLEGIDVQQAREKALIAAKETEALAKEVGDDRVAKKCELGIRHLKLLDSSTKKEEADAIRSAMADGIKAVELISIARAHSIEFDPEPIEKYLANAKRTGGFSLDQLNAKFDLLDHHTRYAEFVTFLDEEWDALAAVYGPSPLIVKKVQALAELGLHESASEFLEEHRQLCEEQLVNRLDLMLSDKRGEDPTKHAIDLFMRTQSLPDLMNAVSVLKARGAWRRLMPLAQELYSRSPTSAHAMVCVRCMRENQISANEISAFLESISSQVEQHDDMLSQRAWLLHESGDFEGAKLLNDVLMTRRGDAQDLFLDMNLAISMGDWERFSSIVVKAKDISDRLDNRTLLSLAKLIGFSDQNEALALAQKVAARASDDAEALIGAHQIAISVRRDDLAMPWMHKAAELSKGTGPVKVLDGSEVVEYFKRNAKSWQTKNDLFREAKVPLHMAVAMFNIPLFNLLGGAARSNATSDPRLRVPIPIRSGNRLLVDISHITRIALDISTLILLSEMGLLEMVLRRFDEVYISSRVMEVLLDERDKVVFHQPSRITEAKFLIAQVASGRLSTVDVDGGHALSSEIGEESASLLEAAKNSGGYYIHPGVIYNAATFMEKPASIDEYSPYVRDSIDVANALCAEGYITEAVLEAATRKLESTNPIPRGGLDDDRALYLDRLAITYLKQSEIFDHLLSSSRKLFIHSSLHEEWIALLRTEHTDSEMIEAIGKLRRSLRDAFASKKLKVLAQSPRKENWQDVRTHILADMLNDTSPVEVVCIDDRMLNTERGLLDRKGKSTEIVTTFDLLDDLVQRGQLSIEDHWARMHLLRNQCFYCLPISIDELRSHVSKSKVLNKKLVETAELKVLRQYIARLNASGVLCTPNDEIYKQSIRLTGTFLIREIWNDACVPAEEAAIKANWLWNFVVLKTDLTWSPNPTEDDKYEEQIKTQLVALFGLLTDDPIRRSAHAAWLDEILRSYVPANCDVINRIVEYFVDVLVQTLDVKGS
ncbi:hypothetical protein [uncultured Oxalicibacterium sp.]|uniref:HTH domain-containing protein n=1 Tax=uncultured Oxalicibacterium sp. TaxID=1168540 RepID=UPI0025F8DFD8|nr:hypothetical protein [uncultured Oxalicibacterium sp.]